MKQKIALAAILTAVLTAGAWTAWNRLASDTRIAVLNYQVTQLGQIIRANDNPSIRLEEITPDQVHRLGRYDLLLINGMGLRITEGQRETIRQAGKNGLRILTTMATNPANDLTNLDSAAAVRMKAYLSYGGSRNYRNLTAYVRHDLEGKLRRSPRAEAPLEHRTENLFHPDPDRPDSDELGFLYLSDYRKYLDAKGIPSDRPAILVTGQMGDPGRLVLELEKRGHTVYAARNLAPLLENGSADSLNLKAVVYLAHGRLGDRATAWLRKKNIPLFAPLNLNAYVSDWEKDPMGMTGGFLSQSIVTPEIDGAIRPYVLFGHYRNPEGYAELRPVPERLEHFCNNLERHLRLQETPAAEKRIAICYYKGPGQNTLTASGLDVVSSLHRLLVSLRDAGYRIDPMPATPRDLEALIFRDGPLYGSYAAGAASGYMDLPGTEWIDAGRYAEWTGLALSDRQRKELEARHGPFPGKHLSRDGRLALPRVDLGNVVLFPQPAAGTGENDFRMVHGTDEAPPHNYIAAYLWARYGFGADAILHFGTHGSLEFTPGKQAAPGPDDWPDALIGETPHFYLYTIGNVGESIMAKRRAYAGLVSHLTPPFLESGLRETCRELNAAIARYQGLQEADRPDRKALEGAAAEIKSKAIALGIPRDLGLDTLPETVYSPEDILRIANFAEELASERITGQHYTLGRPYEPERIASTVTALCTDPVAFGLLALDRSRGKADPRAETDAVYFEARYRKPACERIQSILRNGTPVGTAYICRLTGLDENELRRAEALVAQQRVPDDMMEAMRRMAASGDIVRVRHTDSAAQTAPADRKKTERALRMARMMGASEDDLRKMEAAMQAADPQNSGEHPDLSRNSAPERPDGVSADRQEIALAQAVTALRTALTDVHRYREALLSSPQAEIDALLNALDGGYTSPSPGGDPIANPQTLPTGRNLYAVNPENTPTRAAWEKGKQLAENTLELYRSRHNDSLPRKVSYTLWSSEFIETEGATIAQALYLLGVEPVYDRFGRVTDIRLIPSEQLGRPRIDVVVQTSGQLRDLAASRLFLLDRAVKMAAAAGNEPYPNLVEEGVRESERILTEKGISPKEAREMAAYRVFGGINGNYGTGIQGMVQASDRWNSTAEIAAVYLHNMGAYYGSEEGWESFREAVFEAALSRTDAVVQPRQSNTWGALSLDHVYEFMGGLNLAVRQTTGKSPDAYLSDYRNRHRVRMQELREAIGVESRTTLFNPGYLREKMKGGASEADALAETVSNTFGWNVVRPEAVDRSLWDEIYSTFVEDRHGLGIRRFFEANNPAALEEISAVMLESIRKGMWDASPEQISELAGLHTQLIREFGPSCSGKVCDNAALQEFIAGRAGSSEAAAEYRDRIRQIREVRTETQQTGKVLKKQELTGEKQERTAALSNTAVALAALALLAGAALLIRHRRKQQTH